MEKFKQLGLSEEILRAISELKFTEPTEIQQKAIPLALAGKDIIGGSATGSGKTLAFGAQIIEKNVRDGGIQALILTPTRELAEQVGNSLRHFSKYKRMRIATVYGGVGIGPQVEELRHAEVVVGTPGRVLDHLERRTIDLRKMKILVLDEADKMLDMGFIDDVVSIIEACPTERQTLLFSATISQDITHIAKHYMNHPVEVSVESYVDASKLEQIFYDVPREKKFSLLVHLLRHEKKGLVMVFCNTRHNTDFLGHNLQEQGINALVIHGGLTQQRRNKIMDAFKSGDVYVLICTDVAARGLDIKDVSHVYNYDLPPNSKEYVHRIGRTARAGREGKAINLVSERDYDNFRQVLRDSSLKIKQEDMPQIEEVRVRRMESRGRFGSRGGDRDRRSGGRGGGGSRGFGRGSSGSRNEGRGGYGDRRGDRRDSGRGRSFGGRGRRY